MSINTRRHSSGVKQELGEYTTLELVSVLTHAENSRRQMDRFVESVTAELTRRGKTQERVLSLNLGRRVGGTQIASRFSLRRKQPGPALAVLEGGSDSSCIH
jgi:23S rRNA pseudoU1915 N3-methylase RlmH